MKGKLTSLWYMQKWTVHPSEAMKLCINLFLAEIFRRMTGKRIKLSCRFKRFDLSWRSGSGQLTPLAEVTHVFSEGLLKEVDGKGWTVIDCGANIGLFSLFLRESTLVIAVEPNPDCAQLLRTNLRVNGVTSEVMNVAVSSVEGRLRMNFRPEATVLSCVDEAGSDEVMATTLDRMVMNFQFSQVDLLKLDLEGHECEALGGAQKSLAAGVFRRIYAEYNCPESLEGLDALLLPHGYQRVGLAGYNALYAL